MNNHIRQEQVMELDLKEFIWDMLSQWKAILIVSLLIAALVCGVRYFNDNASYNSAVEAQKEKESLSKDEKITSIVNTLPSDKQEAIWLVMHEKKWIENHKDYLNNSIVMNIDPAEQRELILVYKIEAADKHDNPMLVQLYDSFVSSETTVQMVGKAIDPHKELKYISELFRSNSESSDLENNESIEGADTALTVRIILPKDSNVEDVTKAVTSSLQEQGKKIMPQLPHALSLAHSDVISINDMQAIMDHKTIIESINSLESSVKNTENNMTAEEKAAIAAISAILSETDDLADSNIPLAEDELVAPGLSMKHALIGFILGMFIYAFCFVALTVLKGTVNAASVLETYTKNRLLGEIYYKGKRSGLSKLFHSDIIDKIRYKEKPDYNIQVDMVEEAVEAACKHTEVKDVTLLRITGAGVGELLDNAVSSIADSIISKGINSNEYDASETFEEKALLNMSNAIMVTCDKTKFSQLGKVIDLCRYYGINVLGSVYISEM